MGAPLHPSLAAGRWFELTLMEQPANIGSEVGRATRARSQGNDRVTRPLLLAFALAARRDRQPRRLRSDAPGVGVHSLRGGTIGARSWACSTRNLVGGWRSPLRTRTQE